MNSGTPKIRLDKAPICPPKVELLAAADGKKCQSVDKIIIVECARGFAALYVP